VLGYIGMTLDVVNGERGERGGHIEDGAQARGRFGVHHIVGLNASTTFDNAAAVGPEFGLLIGFGSSRREREIRAFERLLDGAPAGSVIERGSERHACGVREREYALDQPLAEAGLTDDHP